MRRALLAIAIAASALAAARESRAACTDAGACPPNEYCALGDAGAVTDGGPGFCLVEPCVVASDCPGAQTCDTSVEPHRCVGDAGVDAGSPDAGRRDAGAPDSGASDAAAPPVADASDAGDAAIVAVEDAGPPDFGSLNGGACDCDLATPRDAAPAALASSLALAMLWIARRSSKRTRR